MSKIYTSADQLIGLYIQVDSMNRLAYNYAAMHNPG